MPGALYQLVSTGAQDMYIIGKPQITMFKTVYRRHQNFSIYDIIKIPKVKNTFGVDFQFELERAGDLLHKVYLIVDLPELNLRNPRPTCEIIKKILLEYGIIWDTTEKIDYNTIIDNCPEIITLEIYNNIIVEVINNWITRYIDKYNFNSNGNIFSSNPVYLKSSSFEVIDRALKYMFDYVYLYDDGSFNLAIWGERIKEIYLDINKNLLTSGISGSLMLLSRMLTKYAQEYLSVYSSHYNASLLFNKYAVAKDAYGNDKREILMYSNGFRNGYNVMDNSDNNIMFDVGALLQFLLNYYYDTAFVNINPETSKYSRTYLKLSPKSYFISNSLFGDLLTRPPNTLSYEPVKFQLYNLEDFKNIYYLSLLFNLTRLRIKNNLEQYPYDLDHGYLYVGEIKPPLKNPELLGIYNPYISLIDENVIYYHSLDPETTLYNINEANVGTNLNIYFSSIVQNFYNAYIDRYVDVFPFVNSVKFTTLDSYFITQNFFKQLFANSTTSTVTVDTNQVQKIAQLILFYIQLNILYNLAMVRNMIDVINNARFFKNNHYRFTFYKEYKQSANVITSVTNSNATSTFNNNYQNPYISSEIYTQSLKNMNDNFERNIVNNLTYFGPLDDENTRSNIPTKTNGGENITNFFANAISAKIANFRNNCSNVLFSFEKLKYMQNFDIWKRGVFDIGNQIQKTYNENSTSNDPQYEVTDSFSNEYKKIAVMNYTPFLAARDIPAMIYYIFETSIVVKAIFDAIGGQTQFLSYIDYRDDSEDGAPLLSNEKREIKKQIYAIMIDSVIGCGSDLIDKDHYNEIVNAKLKSSFLLINTHRPETLLTKYTLSSKLSSFFNQNNACQFNTENEDLAYLPIEWLTQTYYYIFEDLINNYFDDNINNLSESKFNFAKINDKITNIYQFNSNGTKNEKINLIKDTFMYILKSTINSFIGITSPSNNFPHYTKEAIGDPYKNYYLNNLSNNLSLSYVSNGYTLLGLLNETGKEKKGLFYRNSNDLFISPRFCDATSTIWYQNQKNYIHYYNDMFNETLISKTYYESSVGAMMSDIFDYFKNTINGERFTTFDYNNNINEGISDENAIILGEGNVIGSSSNENIQSITIVIYGSAFGNANLNTDFEERVMIKFINNSSDEQISVLKNHIIGFDLTKTINYSETVQVPSNMSKFEISYINNPGFQTYLTILVFLNGTNKYYEFNFNNYENKILDTWNNLNLQSEPIPPINLINQNGFDFYRMRFLDNINSYTGRTKYNDLTDYINDIITLFNNDLKFYDDYSNILNIVNDETFLYNDGISTKNIKNEDYYYEQSYKILNVLNEHIDIKYINPLPLTNNYNEITTTENFSIETKSNFHQMSDITPPVINEIYTFSNSDVIGFAFILPENSQSNYGFGFSVGKYPYSKGNIQILKFGDDYSLSINDFNNTQNIPITISPANDVVYFMVQYNNLDELRLYENDNLIVTVTNSTNEYLNLLPEIKENLFLFISQKVKIEILDLYTYYDYVDEQNYTIIKNILINDLTKWFYIGLSIDIDNDIVSTLILNTYKNDLSGVEQILQTVYYENNSIVIDSHQNSITTTTVDEHPLGQSVISPVYLSDTDIIGFAFTNLNDNASNLEIGISGVDYMNSNISIYINKDEGKLYYNNNSIQLTDFSFSNNNIYYFIYYNDITTSIRLKLYCLNTSTNQIKKYEFTNTDINFLPFKFIKIIANGEVYIRFYMDRYAYQIVSQFNSNSILKQEIINIMKTGLNWYYTGGTYSIPYNSDLSNIINIYFSTKIIGISTKNIIENIGIGKNNFNDIVFPDGNNELTFSILVNTQMNNKDIIGYAFSVIDNTSNIIGIGLGTDGYYSNNYLAMIRDYNDPKSIHRIEMMYDNDNNNLAKIYYDKDPIFDKNNIYYCFQDNNTGLFTVYEDNNDCPLIQISVADGKYANLLEIFKNNANLIVLGKTTVRFYTAKYAYSQTSTNIQNLIQKVTKWLYLGAEDITPFNTGNNESLINVSHILHTGYLENEIIQRLDTKLYYNYQTQNINQALNPIYYNNIYNTNGIDGKATNLQNDTEEIKYNTSLYGVLDSIYNIRLTGNMDTTFKTLNVVLPEGKLYGDFISNYDNPFYSYCLYDSFLNISSEINYDGYAIKQDNTYPKPSELITYGDLKYMSNIFDDVIHKDDEIEHALQNLLYINQASFTYPKLQLINSSNVSNVTIQTQSSYNHIFNRLIHEETEIPSLVGINYGFAFTINNIIDSDNTTEVGIIIDNDMNKKIVIRKTKISYDLYLQNGEFKQNFYFGATSPISFSSSNIIYFFVDQIAKKIIIWQNAFELTPENGIIIEDNSTPCNLLDLFSLNNVNLYANGNLTINYYSYNQSLSLASSDVKTLMENTSENWLYTNKDDLTPQKIYNSYVYYAYGNVDNYNIQNSDDYNTVTINKIDKFENITKYESQITDYSFLNVFNNKPVLSNKIVNQNDIFGMAFEFTAYNDIDSTFISTPENISIGFGSGSVPEKYRLQIQKNGNDYFLVINEYVEQIYNVDFSDGNIYMIIQNNQEKKLTICRYQNENCISSVLELTINNFYYEKFLTYVFNVNTNILISTDENAKIKFYNAKKMFDISSITNKIRINNLTKWFFIGAQDTTPIKKIVIDPKTLKHHQFTSGLTFGTFFNNSLVTPSEIKFNDSNSNDVILNDAKIDIKPIGIGFFEVFGNSDPTNYADNVIALNNNLPNFKNIYGFAFSVIENYSDFSVGFYAWTCSYITIQKSSKTCKIIIKYYDTNKTCSEEIIDIPCPNFDKNKTYYVFQNNDDETFTFYEEQRLLYKISASDNIAFNNLLNTPTPVYYETSEGSGEFYEDLGTLKTISTIGVSGLKNTTLRFYSKNYLNYTAPVSIKNILNLDKMLWFGANTKENLNIINTADYKTLSVSNSSVYLNPPLELSNNDILGVSFSIQNKEIQDFNTVGIAIGFTNYDNITNIYSELATATSFLEISFTKNTNYILFNTEYYQSQFSLSFNPNDIYHIFQNNIDKNLLIYENGKLAYKVSADESDPNYSKPYADILENFKQPCYMYFQGKADFRIYNAPYAYTNTTPEVKILIDLCTNWISFGGSNIGPIRKNVITSRNIYNDKRIPQLLSDPVKGTLSNFSLVSLYLYLQIIEKSKLNDHIDLSQFIKNIINTHLHSEIENEIVDDNGYTDTIMDLNKYFKEQIKFNFDAITKITNIKLEEHQLFINGFNTFLDNTYKPFPLNFNFNTTFIQRSPYFNDDIEFYDQSPTGRPNGIIYSDLEPRLLKLIMNAPPYYSWVKELGNKIINEVSISIGDQVIEKHTSDLLHLIQKQRITPEQQRGYDKMIGGELEMYRYAPTEGKFSNSYGNGNPYWMKYYPSNERTIKQLYIPLHFWFCNNEGNALPMISLLHSRVMLNFKIEDLSKLLYLEKDSYIYGNTEVKYQVLSQYIYLEEEDRMRMANAKLEYLVEKYNHNGIEYITKDKNFNLPLTLYPINNENTQQPIPNYDQPVFLALTNLTYRKHDFVSNNSSIEQQRIGKLNFLEVITRSYNDHDFSPAFNFNGKKVFGFGFELISQPETKILQNDIKYSNELLAPIFSIGFKIELFTIQNNKKEIQSIKTIELTKDYIIVKVKQSKYDNDYKDPNKKKVLKDGLKIKYIKNPSFRGGGINESKDLYLCFQNDFSKQIYIYENSSLIANIDLNNTSNNEFINENNGLLDNGLLLPPNEPQFKRNISLYVYGTTRIFYYNAKEIYNSVSLSLRKTMESLTDWLFVGAGDTSPITEIINYQETPIQKPGGYTIKNISNGKSQIQLFNGDKVNFTPSVNTSSNSLIGFAFSINNDLVVKNYDLMVGLTTDSNMIVAFQKINKNYVIYISDGTNSISVPFFKKPINTIQDNKIKIQKPEFRPEIIYVCIQDNISKTFTIYEDNEIIGQIDANSQNGHNYGNLYNKICQEFSKNAKFYLENMYSSEKILVNYYTSNEIIAKHARLVLRRIINNVTHWLSLTNFKPNFYVPSSRNISTTIIDNIGGGGKITNQTQISSDVITNKDNYQYLLRPTTFTDITQMIGFSFSILDPVSDDFEIGISAVNNVFKRIVIKKTGTNYSLQTNDINNVPSNFEKDFFPSSLAYKSAINEILKYNQLNIKKNKTKVLTQNDKDLIKIQKKINEEYKIMEKKTSSDEILKLQGYLNNFSSLISNLIQINIILNIEIKNGKNNIQKNEEKKNILNEINKIKNSKIYQNYTIFFDLTYKSIQLKYIIEQQNFSTSEKDLVLVKTYINEQLNKIKKISEKIYTDLTSAIYEYGILIKKQKLVKQILNFNQQNNTIDENAIEEDKKLTEEINKITISSLYLEYMELFELSIQVNELGQKIINENYDATVVTKIPQCSSQTSNLNLICSNTKEYPLLENLSSKSGSIYTIIQDNTLGTFTLFHNEKIIGQLTLSDTSYSDLLSEFRNGINIFICGKTNLRFYSSQYIYQSSSEFLKKYIDRIDKWSFVRTNIEQPLTQYAPFDPTTVQIRINMNDPVKYFIWYMKAFNEKTEQPMDMLCWNRYGYNVRDNDGNWINFGTGDFVKEMKLQMFGVDRERYREEGYFTYVVPYGRYTHAQTFNDGEYMYSFALYPQMLQPSGAANYSEIDDSWLNINFTNEVEKMIRENEDIKIKFELWGKTMNILRICSGMGAFLFQKA
jgi:hypothetical protein